jgi:hypothetical protein
MNTTRADALTLTSTDESIPDRDRPSRTRVKIRAADAFDRRDHEMSAAAHQLHVEAMASSAARDHPGFVPDEYLAGLTGEDLHSPGANPAILASELCTAGMWRRADGGYRVLDWPAVQASIDHERELRTVDKPPLPRQGQRGRGRAGRGTRNYAAELGFQCASVRVG